MMKRTLSITALMLLAGCSNTQTVKEAQNFAACTFPDSPEIEAPAWICDVMPTDLAMGAMGYAKKSAAGMSIQRKIAVNDARVALASQFQTDVSNLFRQAIENKVTTDTALGNSEQALEVVENVTKNVVSRSLANSRVIVSQVSPSGGLYVLVGMNEDAYQNNLNLVVDAASEDSKLWDQFNNEQAAADLTEVFNSLKTR